MIWAILIGNTRTVVGLMKGKKVVKRLKLFRPDSPEDPAGREELGQVGAKNFGSEGNYRGQRGASG